MAELTQAEIDGLPLDKRLELLALERQSAEATQARQDAERERERARRDTEKDRRRQARHQWINSVVLLVGIILAFITWRTGQDELSTSRDNLATVQQGQVTERYTQAVEQLGSGKRDVRTAAIYALERIATDSDRDRLAIRDVLAAFVREHDPDPTKIKDNKLPKEPDTDILAALTVLARRPADPRTAPRLDLHGIRTPAIIFSAEANVQANLRDANLSGARLYFANLYGANLSAANLSGSSLRAANLSGTALGDANLIGADLGDANLTNANLTDADLRTANLRGANLIGANLSGTNLIRANLRGANLYGANLIGADLGNADLRGVVGMSEEQIRKVARTDRTTRFGPLPNP